MDQTRLIFIIGLLAAACTTLSFIPQAYHIWKRRSADDVSAVMFTIFSTGSFLWFVYGLGIKSLPISLANGITLILNLSILFLKWKFRASQNEKKA